MDVVKFACWFSEFCFTNIGNICEKLRCGIAL